MDNLIEKYAMQCISWPTWRDLPNEDNQPAPMITEWPDYVTEAQKEFWRLFVKNMLDDLKGELSLVSNDQIQQILNLLNSK